MALKAKKSKKPPKPKRALRVQYGALPYRIGEAGMPEFLLVTTRISGRWIVPKGGPIKDLKPPKSAAQEAFEEAGIRGTIGAKPLGAFAFDKTLADTGSTVPCEVWVFPLLVKRQYKNYPEAEERASRWFTPEEALAALNDAGLCELIALFTERLAGRKNPVKKKKASSVKSQSARLHRA